VQHKRASIIAATQAGAIEKVMLTTLMLLVAAHNTPLRLATYAYPRYDRTQALAPTKALLAARLDREVTIALYPTPDALRDAVLGGEVDVAMTNLSAFLGMRRSPDVAAIAVLDVPPATLDTYRGVLLARRGVDVNNAAQLSAKASALRYAEVLPGSTSGALVQADYMRRSGIRRDGFSEVNQTGTHDAALDALLSGHADIAALAEEPWRRLKAERPSEAARIVQLWRSDPLPPGPIICVHSSNLSCDQAGEVLRSPDASAAAKAMASGWSETAGAQRFRAVTDSDYQAFREAGVD
jgi:ABC-type phosphate/phosphonate transport system substrate-binding protein